MPSPRSKPQRSWSHKLGPSQKRVLDYLKTEPKWEATSYRIGILLHPDSARFPERARQWAYRVLAALRRRGLVEFNRETKLWKAV